MVPVAWLRLSPGRRAPPDILWGVGSVTRRIALVTGGGRGIGAATAQALAVAGHDVAIGFRERADAAGQVAAACREQGVRALPVRADLTTPDGVRTLFEAVDAGLGTVGVLVNNAGIVPPLARVDEMDGQRLRTVLEATVTQVLLACGEAVRRMSTAHGGRGGVIVNVSSMAAKLGAAGEYVDYAAGKAAVDAVTTGLGREVVGEGVRVVGVRPGPTTTDIHAPGRLERVTARLPMGRPSTVDEVAAAIAWLASDAASYVTAATLDVGGGA